MNLALIAGIINAMERETQLSQIVERMRDLLEESDDYYTSGRVDLAERSFRELLSEMAKIGELSEDDLVNQNIFEPWRVAVFSQLRDSLTDLGESQGIVESEVGQQSASANEEVSSQYEEHFHEESLENIRFLENVLGSEERFTGDVVALITSVRNFLDLIERSREHGLASEFLLEYASLIEKSKDILNTWNHFQELNVNFEMSTLTILDQPNLLFSTDHNRVAEQVIRKIGQLEIGDLGRIISDLTKIRTNLFLLSNGEKAKRFLDTEINTLLRKLNYVLSETVKRYQELDDSIVHDVDQQLVDEENLGSRQTDDDDEYEYVEDQEEEVGWEEYLQRIKEALSRIVIDFTREKSKSSFDLNLLRDILARLIDVEGQIDLLVVHFGTTAETNLSSMRTLVGSRIQEIRDLIERVTQVNTVGGRDSEFNFDKEAFVIELSILLEDIESKIGDEDYDPENDLYTDRAVPIVQYLKAKQRVFNKYAETEEDFILLSQLEAAISRLESFAANRRVVDQTDVETRGAQGLDMEWLGRTLEAVESVENFVSDDATLPDNINFTQLKDRIKNEVGDPVLREKMMGELTARVYLHDAFLNFYVSKFNIESIKEGYLSLSPVHFETLLHGIEGVRELVPIAVGMFEMALKGIYPGFEHAKAMNWRVTSGAVYSEIASRLGPKGALAANIASRIVEATGMIAFYETDFAFSAAMNQRDVYMTEKRRESYGKGARVEGAGLRPHGFHTTIGKYWNRPGSINEKTNKPINPIIKTHYEYGEPPWDLIGDFWAFAKKIDPSNPSRRLRTEPIQGSPRTALATLSRNNRYHVDEAPDFDRIQQNLRNDGSQYQLEQSQVDFLENLPWHGIVAYDRIHFVSNGRNLVGEKDYVEWVEQMKGRLKFHKLITDTHFNPDQFISDNWYEDNKTTFDYLIHSAKDLMDMSKEEQDKALRRIQALFLYSVLKAHTPGKVPEGLQWPIEKLELMINVAESSGFISKSQAEQISKNLGLSGILGRARMHAINHEALVKAGLPGS